MNYSLPQVLDHFSFDHSLVEKNVSEGKENYKGLMLKALYTSREDFFKIFAHPMIQGTFVDLGCGVGEGCLLYGSLFPERKAIGVEFEKPRLEVGEGFRIKHQLSNVHLVNEDLLKAEIPAGDTYFMYFPTGIVLDRILKKLYESSRDFYLVAIESHGDFYNRLDLENWLEVVAQIPLSSSRHNSHARIYKRNHKKRSEGLLPFSLSFEKQFLVIEDSKESWVGETYGLEWVKENQFKLLTPPRSLSWDKVKKVLSANEIQNYSEMINLWPLGELRILTTKKTFYGLIRKIIIEPSCRLELSTGEKVEWNEITSIYKDNELCYSFS